MVSNEKVCRKCGKSFRSYSNFGKFCSACTTFKCKKCGVEYRRWAGNKTRFCSKKCFDDYRRGKKLDKPQRISNEERHRRKLAMNDLWAIRKEEMKAKIKESMQRNEVKKKLSELNSRPRVAMTDEHKAKISDKLVGAAPENQIPIYPEKIKVGNRMMLAGHGWIELGGKRCYMRSGWERNMARYYQWLKEHGEIKEWEYEVKRFVFEKIQFGNRSYLPDFKITENNGSYYWVEIKGYMTQGAATKLKRMAKYFPEEKVLIVDGEEYNEIRKQIRKLIPDWEGR